MSYREAGLEVFHMEMLGRAANRDNIAHAVGAAIEAAVATAGREFLITAREDLLVAAEYIDSNEDNDLIDDGPASLIWFAMELNDTLPPELRKEAT